MTTRRTCVCACILFLIGTASVPALGQAKRAEAREGKPLPKSESENRPELRIWTDSTGRFTVEARFLDFNEGRVRLQKANGDVITVAHEKLSKPDQEYARAAESQRPGNQNGRRRDSTPRTSPETAAKAKDAQPLRMSSLLSAYVPKSRRKDSKAVVYRVMFLLNEERRSAVAEALKAKGEMMFVGSVNLVFPSIEVIFEGSGNDEPLQAFNEGKFKVFLQRIPSVPKDTLESWCKLGESNLQMEAAGYRTALLFALCQTDRLWDGNSFRRSESDVLQKRMRSVPKPIVSEWAEAEKLDDALVALWVAQSDELFTDGQFNLQRAKRIISALKSAQK